MPVIVPINSDKIVEILFENSEEVPNDIYLNIMNLMKRYHEHGDNENEIRLYLDKVDIKIKKRFEKYINRQIKFECIKCDCSYFKCNCGCKCDNAFTYMWIGFFTFITIMVLYFIIVNKLYPRHLSPPPSLLPPN